MENVPSFRDIKTVLKYPLEIILCFLIVALVGVIFIQVLFRYVFELSLAWSEEIARFLLMWLGALSAAYAFKTRSHFALRFVVSRFSNKIQQTVSTIVVLVLVIFLGIFVYQAYNYMMSGMNQISPGTRIPMTVPFSSAFAGGILMLYYVVSNWWTETFRSSEDGQ